MNLSRKDFLTQGLFSLGRMLQPARGADQGAEPPPPLRPPGFITGREMACGECDSCRSACPEGVITLRPDVSGPVMEFGTAGCRFCYHCSGTCPSGVLALPAEGEKPRLGVARSGAGCLAGGGCFTCSERCPEGAITVAWGAGISIDPERCSGCGWCEASCPVRSKAIRVEKIM